jgi:hypothetical protein
MQGDAEQHSKIIIERALRSQTQAALEEHEMINHDVELPAEFVDKLNKELYSGIESLGDRIDKFKNRHQRGNTELHKFL